LSGRTQVIDLMLPPDFFSASASQGEDAVEAITWETVPASYPGGRIDMLAACDRHFARELQEVASQSLARIQSQLMVLGGVKAVEKVGSFLLALDGRASNEGAVELPVTRYVIAEYLAVSRN
jgi:CRP/FNR family nitrogen fixation transcriptional regulator